MTQEETLRKVAARYPYRWLGTVQWITKDGTRHRQYGQVTGKATGGNGGQYLVITVPGAPTGKEKVYAGFKAICRAINMQEQRKAQRGETCEECGAKLGYLDDYSGLEGFCFDCV